MAVRGNRCNRHHVAGVKRWQECFFVGGVFAGLFARCNVDGAVAGERDCRAGGCELAFDELAGGAVKRLGDETDRDRDTSGVGHLRRQRALPDQPVQRKFLAVKFGRDAVWRAIRSGWADGFVSILPLGLLLVLLWCGVEVLRSVLTRHCVTSRRHCLFGEDDVVGTHVRDEATLVQTLGHTHDLAGRETELAAAFLLQRRGHEWRLG